MLESLTSLIIDSPLNQWILDTYWLWPVLEIVHFFGLSLLLGGLIIIDLRLMGYFRSLNLETINNLVPLVMCGFSLNLVTGILFFIGDPMRYSVNIGFQIKMGLVILAGLNTLFYSWKMKPALANSSVSSDTPISVKIVGLISLLAWTGVLVLGRLIPYVGTG